METPLNEQNSPVLLKADVTHLYSGGLAHEGTSVIRGSVQYKAVDDIDGHHRGRCAVLGRR